MSATGSISTELGCFVDNTVTAAGNTLTIANPAIPFQIIGLYAYEVTGATVGVAVHKNTIGGDQAAAGNTGAGLSGWNALPLSTTLANTIFTTTDNVFVNLINPDIKAVYIRMIHSPADPLTIVQT